MPAPDARDQPMVSFIIPVRNDAGRLACCLRSISDSQYPPELIEVIVVDNGSTDESASVARSLGATVLSLPRLRLGELRNRAVSSAHGEVLAFVDADHEIVPGWVPSALSVLSEDSIAAVGAPCRPPSPATWVQRLYDRLRRHPLGRDVVDWLGSGNLAIKRSAFEAVGGFDPSLETCEDVDLCRKLRSREYVLIADSRLQNVHYGDPPTLRQVFFGELWRGRDNVRVSFRAPRTWRTLASAAVPVFNLSALVLAGAGLLLGSADGFLIAGLSGFAVLFLVGLRTSMMVRGASSRELPQAFAVASAYELGRAFAVIGRFSHNRRREGATA